MTQGRSHSISVRLRRLVEQTGYVNVPITAAVMSDAPDVDGHLHIDPDKLFSEAVGLAGQISGWDTDNVQVEVHPIQQAS